MAKKCKLTVVIHGKEKSESEELLKKLTRKRDLSAFNFEKEPDNPHDSDAVKVLLGGKKLGYVVSTSGIQLEGSVLAADFGKVLNRNYDIEVLSVGDDSRITEDNLYFEIAFSVSKKKEEPKAEETTEENTDEGTDELITLAGTIVCYPKRSALVQKKAAGEELPVDAPVEIKFLPDEAQDNLRVFFEGEALGHIPEKDENYDFLVSKKKYVGKFVEINEKTRVVISVNTKAASSFYTANINRIVGEGILSKDEVLERIQYLEDIGVDTTLINDVLSEIKAVPEELKDRASRPKALFKDPENKYIGKALDYLLIGANLSLNGPKGVGKNTFSDTLSWIRNMAEFENNICEDTTEEAIKGGKVFETDENGNMKLVHEMVQLRIWAKYGGDYILDEANMGRPSIMAVINALADDRRRYEIPGIGVECLHPSCRLILTLNDSDDYAGTSEQNEATKDRFTPIDFEYPSSIVEILSEMMRSKGKDVSDSEMQGKIDICQNIYNRILDNVGDTVSASALSIRGFGVALRARRFREALIDNVAHKGKTPEEKEVLEDIVNNVFPDNFMGAIRTGAA